MSKIFKLHVAVLFQLWLQMAFLLLTRESSEVILIDFNETWQDYRVNIGLSGKFVPMLKENWNAENLNFIFIKLYRLVGTNFPDNPI